MKEIDKRAILDWDQFKKDISKATPPEHLSEAEKARKKAYLEKHPVEWMQYFFPNYASCPFAPFQKEAINRIYRNDEWYEVWSWSRELAKSTVSMMLELYLMLTGRKRYLLMVSATQDSAIRLLAPYRANLESNGRIKDFYGEQASMTKWEESNFVTTSNLTFLAVGYGNAPRGTRNESVRPDIIDIDDYDTDKDCRNPVILDKKTEFIERAVIPTRSVSRPTLILAKGNLIAKDTRIGRFGAKADKHMVVNIVDKDGNSSWPEKNSQEHIERVKATISKGAFQAEYMNNPIHEGKVFKNIPLGKMPSLSKFKFLVCYGDPSTSNKGKEGSSTKAVCLVGRLKTTYYIFKAFVDRPSNAAFIDWYYQCKAWVAGRCPVFYLVENNSLQDPFYEQVFLPLIREENRQRGDSLFITGDSRPKTDKAARIEANLEPIDRNGAWLFNEDEADNPHMKELLDQLLLFEMTLPYPADGPDCLEGAIAEINRRMALESSPIDTISREDLIDARYRM
jgi:hypothetical protein